MMKRSSMSQSAKPLKRSGFSASKKFALPCRKTLSAVSEASFKARKPMKRKQKSIPAAEAAHYRAVAALPCACCGIIGYSQVAHSNRHQDGKGLGLKAHYRATFPLCCARPGEIGCHIRHDQCIGITREQADLRTVDYIVNTLFQLGLRHD